MDYGQLVRRAANIVWQNKYLIVLGILVSLGSGNFSGGGGGGGGGGNGSGSSGQFPEVNEQVAGLAIGLVIGLICLLLLVAIALWVVSTIARGGLIAGVDSIESGSKSSFRQAWSAGWQRVWTLLGIGLLPAIPGLLLFVIAVIGLVAYGGMFAFFGEEFSTAIGVTELGITAVVLACIVVPVVLVLSILRNFAERAAMLEDLGVIASYRRGLDVLMANLGQAIILFLVQVAIFIVLGILLFVPGVVVVLCCFLWPLLLAAQGAASAFVSALWTLAWRTWTGDAPAEKAVPAV